MAFYQRLKDLKEDADLTQEEISEINDKTFCSDISPSRFIAKFSRLDTENKARIDERMSQMLEVQEKQK